MLEIKQTAILQKRVQIDGYKCKVLTTIKYLNFIDYNKMAKKGKGVGTELLFYAAYSANFSHKLFTICPVYISNIIIQDHPSVLI